MDNLQPVNYSKTCLKRPLKKKTKSGFSRMQVKIISEEEHSAILSTFIKLPFATKTFVLSIFEWPPKTGFTVSLYMMKNISANEFHP